MKKAEDEALRLKEALSSNDIIAEAIKFSAVWEATLDSYLAFEFGGTTARYNDFVEFIAPNLSFARKIEIFKSLSLVGKTKSHSEIVSTLNRVRKIRNHLAHAQRLDDSTIAKIQSDRSLVQFVLGHPMSFKQEGKRLHIWFSHMWRGWEARLKKDRAHWAIWIKENPGWGYEKYLPRAD
ncbi:hypothetical protein JN531_015550 [Flagellatimonas centrodinii]|uniref:hypothetical protein n=1 Tax=Flagellatimonas centrodinii TaxID=2806210 RepID=UPI001FF05C20|nr:hypothetical protein [Flagellatimonas centrodinii]ULQ46501.1 hypothetical protein JN531_015550 [Flagellatimonas centrodinii]